MKSTLLWSLTALCGVVGGVVAWNGGWRSISPTWTPIRITKVVWVTNVVNQPDQLVYPSNGTLGENLVAFILSVLITLVIAWAGGKMFRIVNERF